MPVRSHQIRKAPVHILKAAKCFSFKPNHGVSNSQSIAELFRITVGDCLNYCILNAAKNGDGCSSVVYHKSHSTCQIYGHNGNFNGSEVVEADEHDFYERTSWVGVCQDKVVPKRGYKQRPRQYAAMSKVTQESIDISSYRNSANHLMNKENTMTIPSTSPVPSDTQSYSEELAEEHFDSTTPTISFFNPTHNSDCQKKEKVSYFVFFGHRMASKMLVSRLKGIDQSSCVMYCTQNINANGEPIACYSANYEPAEENCLLYGKRSNTRRTTAPLAADANYIFAEKFCVETKKDCSAETPYIVYPAKQMHKKIITSYPGMNSVVACVAACIDNRKCKAVTYKIGLCILHAVSPASDSSLFVEGNEQTMVIENGCQLTTETLPSLLSNKIASHESPWEEWSLCQFAAGGQKVRVRQRECNDCEDLQIEPC
ncbi:hypothetical protein Q1695_000837 [Nippostrongylus brasiliensis]|nr:hypothetical protein Q1695_000837 [Nippostrongylus brasiliensis]